MEIISAKKVGKMIHKTLTNGEIIDSVRVNHDKRQIDVYYRTRAQAHRRPVCREQAELAGTTVYTADNVSVRLYTVEDDGHGNA